MRIARYDVHSNLLTAIAKEEEAFGHSVHHYIKCVGGCYGATEQRVGNATGERQPRVAPREAFKGVGEVSCNCVGEIVGTRRLGDGCDYVGSERSSCRSSV